MRLIVVGASHRTAPVELRERLSVDAAEGDALLGALRGSGLASEGVVLSTCNRLELYVAPKAGVGPRDLATWLADRSGVPRVKLEPAVYGHLQEDALRHIFRVTSGLDSMVVGEPQIVGQVKTAWRHADGGGHTGPVLRRALERAFHVAKRVRTETDVAREAVSIGRSGVQLARQVLGALDGRAALLVGAGQHGKVVARALLDYGLSELVIANRTFSKASDLAARFGGAAIPLSDAERYLDRVDIVLVSVGGGRRMLDQKVFVAAARRRRQRPLVVVDLSVPRVVDPAANDVDGVYRFDVDDLAQLAARGRERRLVAATVAEQLVAEEVADGWRMLVESGANGRFGEVVRHAESVRQAELARAAGVLGELDPRQRRAVDALSRALVKKLLHRPLSTARGHLADGRLADLDTLLGALAAPPDPAADAPPNPELRLVGNQDDPEPE